MQRRMMMCSGWDKMCSRWIRNEQWVGQDYDRPGGMDSDWEV